MDEFERLLAAERTAVERYVRFRVSAPADAEDILQETYLSAYQRFSQLKDKAAFKAWLIRIARNKCNDHFRARAERPTVPLEAVAERATPCGRHGSGAVSAVRETLASLSAREREILLLSYWEDLPQAEIARRLGIPVGTVKSRLYTAKQSFKRAYPYPPHETKGDTHMQPKLPKIIPAYTIEPVPEPPFSVKWEELMGWFLVPRLGERLAWGMYDMPSRRLGEYDESEVIGRAEVHGIEGVEIRVTAYDPMPCNSEGGRTQVERTFIAQLTDTHCRYLAESHVRDGVKRCYTFLDGESFLGNWGFGEDNCGNETNLSPKGDITRTGTTVTSVDKAFLLDIVGRYTVTIGGKAYDTVCVMDIETYDSGVASEQFLDRNGRTVLWRRFNRDDWAIERYGRPWSEQLPDNDRLMVNGATYVHWYDCITDYIL